MQREVKEPMIIEDGLHVGVITQVLERKKPYEYIDIVIEFEEGKKIKAGYPDYLSTVSKLGSLLARFGADVSTPNTFLDPEKVLIGQKCTFQTIKDGNFSNVIPESLRPVPAGYSEAVNATKEANTTTGNAN